MRALRRAVKINLKMILRRFIQEGLLHNVIQNAHCLLVPIKQKVWTASAAVYYQLEYWQLTCQFPTWQSPVWSSSHRHKWLITNHPLHERLMSLSSARVHLQLMQSQNWLPWQRPLDPRSRLCLHWIACSRKPTPRIKEHVASCHTTEVIAHRKPKSGCHGNVP